MRSSTPKVSSINPVSRRSSVVARKEFKELPSGGTGGSRQSLPMPDAIPADKRDLLVEGHYLCRQLIHGREPGANGRLQAFWNLSKGFLRITGNGNRRPASPDYGRCLKDAYGSRPTQLAIERTQGRHEPATATGVYSRCWSAAGAQPARSGCTASTAKNIWRHES